MTDQSASMRTIRCPRPANPQVRQQVVLREQYSGAASRSTCCKRSFGCVGRVEVSAPALARPAGRRSCPRSLPRRSRRTHRGPHTLPAQIVSQLIGEPVQFAIRGLVRPIHEGSALRVRSAYALDQLRPRIVRTARA